MGRIAAKLARVPVVIYTAHGFYFHEGMSKKQYQIYFSIEKYIGKLFTDYIFTQSEEDYKLAVENNFLRKSKSQNYLHISNGVDLNYKFNYDRLFQNSTKSIEEIKAKHNILPNDKVVTFIGRLVQEKGILDLLEAYNQLKSTNVKFIIIGLLDNSERDQKSINKINKFKENPDIIFTGQISNANEYLYMSDIFYLPSYREGMPRSIIEAMSMKNAVIATNIRGSREEVVDGVTGYLVNTKDSKKIAEKIDFLIQNPAILDGFKEKGYQRAHELFNESVVIGKQLDVFERAVEKQEYITI